MFSAGFCGKLVVPEWTKEKKRRDQISHKTNVPFGAQGSKNLLEALIQDSCIPPSKVATGNPTDAQNDPEKDIYKEIWTVSHE